MMVKERSENAFDTIRIRGYWWIPDGSTEPQKIPGELTFDVQSGGVLDLYDAFSDTFREIPVIHGLGAQGECVTIFNGMTVGLPMNGNSIGCFRRETISFFDMWVGNHWFYNKEEVCFKEYSFGIHNIENWADQHCFLIPKTIKAKAQKYTIAYKPPKTIILFQNEQLSIVLDAFWSGPSYSVGQLESSIQHYPRIVLRSKEELLPYYGKGGSLSEREWMIFVLIALLMGTVTWKFGFEGILQSLTIGERVSDCVPEISVRHYFQHNWGEVDSSNHLKHFELLFPYSAIHQNFPTNAAHFFELLHGNKGAIAVLYRFQCVKHPFSPSTLPELLFAFEELEKNLLRKKNELLEQKEKSLAKDLRRKLEPLCAEKEWQWASKKLTTQGISFAIRCRIAFQYMKTVFPELDAKMQSHLIEYFKRARNKYAHAASSTSDDYTLYVYASHWLAEFMTLMILRACGVSAKKIKEVFFREWGPDHGKTKRFFNYIQNEVTAGRLK